MRDICRSIGVGVINSTKRKRNIVDKNKMKRCERIQRAEYSISVCINIIQTFRISFGDNIEKYDLKIFEKKERKKKY